MHKLIISFFIFSFYINFLQAEVIKKIEVIGNKRVSDETIKLYGDINLNKDYHFLKKPLVKLGAWCRVCAPFL